MSYALVIDDNRQMADSLCQMLEMLGIAHRAAYGASPAMSILGRETPQMVFLDINMPGLDGIELLAYLQREPRLTQVPVIVVTSDDQPETREHVLANGAKAFIVKPAIFETLEKVLQRNGLL